MCIYMHLCIHVCIYVVYIHVYMHVYVRMYVCNHGGGGGFSMECLDVCVGDLEMHPAYEGRFW